MTVTQLFIVLHDLDIYEEHRSVKWNIAPFVASSLLDLGYVFWLITA